MDQNLPGQAMANEKSPIDDFSDEKSESCEYKAASDQVSSIKDSPGQAMANEKSPIDDFSDEKSESCEYKAASDQVSSIKDSPGQAMANEKSPIDDFSDEIREIRKTREQVAALDKILNQVLPDQAKGNEESPFEPIDIDEIREYDAKIDRVKLAYNSSIARQEILIKSYLGTHSDWTFDVKYLSGIIMMPEKCEYAKNFVTLGNKALELNSKVIRDDGTKIWDHGDIDGLLMVDEFIYPKEVLRELAKATLVFFEAGLLIAEIYSQEKQHTASIEMYEYCLKFFGGHGMCRILSSVTKQYCYMGQEDKALERLIKAKKIAPPKDIPRYDALIAAITESQDLAKKLAILAKSPATQNPPEDVETAEDVETPRVPKYHQFEDLL